MEENMEELSQEEALLEEEDIRQGKYMTFEIGKDTIGVELVRQ